jgi:D-glycero-beta-D-manno-heptose 1-phosphate adenylyltransferase
VSFEHKLTQPEAIASVLRSLPRPWVFTNGVFDLLHRGHVTYLDRACGYGASLIVAVNSDASVRRLGKGADRPVNNCEDRMAVLAALASTACVTWFGDDTPLMLIQAIRPDVLVKGGDWPVEAIVGAEFVKAYGGVVLSIPFQFERSTTATVKAIRAGKND